MTTVCLCQEVDWLEDLGLVDLVVVPAEEVHDELDYIKERERPLDRLVKIEILLCVLRDVFQEVVKRNQGSPKRIMLLWLSLF